MSSPVAPAEALLYVMVVMSAADQDMTDAELKTIGQLVETVPVFRAFDPEQVVPSAEHCAALLAKPNGLERVLEAVVASLSEGLRETAYVLACDVAAADGQVTVEEMRLLELFRERLDIDRLVAVALERSARARARTH
ncbi:tellurite resistance TerB family protein [Zavarzinia sp. CC-PAN008]|uniref:tellurite resistance TerB family protein n=1 Tax=Zavarzinia sp. CC-PAN008 TaxID=3243332 RepID=UPI003F74223A